MNYQVKLSKFEGPLDLLLELIEKEKLTITEFSLSRVADQYLEFIKNSQNIHLENLADFLSVASKLILIKSRALLPMLKVTDEEEAEIKDLEYQLAEYKKFKDAAVKVGRMAKLGRICYSREGFKGIRAIFYPPEDLNTYDIKKYFLSVLSQIPNIEILQEEVVNDVVTLEERINDLANHLKKRVEASFSDLVAGSTDKIQVIVSFLAMLEMVKQRIVDVDQKEIFEEIRVCMKAN